MSIVTMTNKVKAKQGVSREGFSLKGTRRNINGIGFNTLVHKTNRTIFKGTAPTGYGGMKSSKFPLYVVYSGSTGHIPSIQTSTINTKAVIRTRIYPKNKYVNGDCESPCRTMHVKTIDALNHSQGNYVKTLKQKNFLPPEETIQPCVEDDVYMLGTRKVSRNNYVKNEFGAVTSGEYTELNLMRNNCLPTPPCKQSFPMLLNTTDCMPYYDDPQKAIDAGLLPKDWMKCTTKYPTYCVYLNNPYT